MISKTHLIKVLGPLGGYAIIRWIMRKQPRILMYHRFSRDNDDHRVSRAAFESQVRYMKKHLNVISLSALREHLRQKKEPPKNSIVLTIDDGYRDFYEVAYPLLKKYQLPATLFVTTGFINRELWLWPDKITYLLANVDRIPDQVRIGEQQFQQACVNQDTKPKVWNQIVSYLLSISDEEKHVWIAEFARLANVDLVDSPPEEFSACTWEQLSEMQAYGIEIGGHTHTHPSLGHVHAAQLHQEIELCRQHLDEKLGDRKRDFCFPNGQPNDYSEETKNKLKEFGFCSSVTAFYDSHALEDLFEMRRHVGAQDWFQQMKSVNGVEALMAMLTSANNISIGKLS